MTKKEKKEKRNKKSKMPEIPSSKLIKQFGNSNYKMFQSEGHNYQPQEHPNQDRSSIFQNEFNKARGIL